MVSCKDILSMCLMTMVKALYSPPILATTSLYSFFILCKPLLLRDHHPAHYQALSSCLSWTSNQNIKLNWFWRFNVCSGFSNQLTKILTSWNHFIDSFQITDYNEVSFDPKIGFTLSDVTDSVEVTCTAKNGSRTSTRSFAVLIVSK